MFDASALPLYAALFVVAALYSSVGHAGASGYIAAMSLFGIAATEIRPVALVLNILVASITAWRFASAGHFSWRLFWPFALLSIPLAFVGGYLHVPTYVLKPLLGLVLWFSAARFLLRPSAEDTATEPPPGTAIPVGAGLGLLAGLTGTGGGIFLTPLLLFLRWARAKQAAAVSALFILVNSAAGLVGNVASTKSFPEMAVPFAACAVGGGLLGSHFGSRRFDHRTIKRCLAVVLLVAGGKLLFSK
jgi:uncharacterized membrane protein YfcA